MTDMSINFTKTFLLILFCLIGLLSKAQLLTAEEPLFIESLGRTFSQYEAKQLNLIRFSEIPILESDLEKLKYFGQLNQVSFYKTKLPDSIFDHLQSIKLLKTLVLEYVTISPKTLLKISKLSQLQRLHIRSVNITAAGLSKIVTLKNLSRLEISYTTVTLQMVTLINKLKNLKTLILKNTQLNDIALSAIQLPELQQLDISYSNIRGSGFEGANRFNKLGQLNVSHTLFEDESFKHLSLLKELRSLDISDTLVTSLLIQNLKLIPAIEYLILDNLPLSKDILPVLLQLKRLSKLSINGILIKYEALMLFKEQATDIKVIAHYLISDAHGLISTSDFNQTMTPQKARFILKEPVLMGVAVPFEIIFLNKKQQSEPFYQLKNDIILKVKDTVFNVYLGLNHYSGDQIIEIQASKIPLDKGIIQGEISFQRVKTRRKVEVYLKQPLPDKPELIGESRIDLFYNQVAGVLFSTETKRFIAGQANFLKLGLFDYLGKPYQGKFIQPLILSILGQYPLEINGKKILNRYQLIDTGGKKYKDISLIGQKAGRYTIRFDNNFYYGIKQTGHFWNTFTFYIEPDVLLKSVFKFPEKIEIDTPVSIQRFDLDQFNNQIVSTKLTEVVFSSENREFVSINSNRLSNNHILISTETDLISFQRQGEYKIQLKGLGEIITKTITIK